MSDVSRRYVASLAAVAVLVLTAGLIVRSRLYPTPVETAPPSEASTLRQLSQEGQLRRTAAYVGEQVETMVANVQHVAATGASGLWWTADTLLSTTHARPVVPIARTAVPSGGRQRTDSLRRGVVVAPDSTDVAWVILVGSDSAGAPVSAQFLAGGRATARCDGVSIQRYVLGAPLDGSLAGAGVFRLDGRALGLVVWCDGELVAVPADAVRRLLAESRGPTHESAFGFSVAPASPLVRAFVDSDTALLVTFVRTGSVADDAGLEAGDVLAAIDGRAATAGTERLATASDSLLLARKRERGVDLLTIRPAADDDRGGSLGVELETSDAVRGVPVAHIRSGSRAARAGLRAGDRLLRVGSTTVTSMATADRLLSAAGRAERPALVIVAREDGEHALLVAAPSAAGTTDSTSAPR